MRNSLHDDGIDLPGKLVVLDELVDECGHVVSLAYYETGVVPAEADVDVDGGEYGLVHYIC